MEGAAVSHVATPGAVGIAAFPFVPENPYQRLLYDHGSRCGLELEADAEFTAGWLVRARGRVRVAHFHWPQNHYAWWRRPHRLRRPLSWLKLSLFALRLTLARLLGYRIVWTIHEVFPHESFDRRLDRAGGRLLVRFAHALLAHDEATASKAAVELGARDVAVVPHGPYVGVYPEGRARGPVRAALGIDPDAVVFICFGHIRAYKGIDLLLAAFAEVELPGAVLIVAGPVVDEDLAAEVRQAAARDARIVAYLDYVPDETVNELFGAADVAVLPRGDGGTSGALLLSLTLGVPTVVSRRPVYEEVLDGESCGWIFEPGDRGSLRDALVRAGSDPAARTKKAAAADVVAERLSWDDIAARTAAIVTGAS
jgi:glycosyltransferase involved in cell wall biosynthesis